MISINKFKVALKCIGKSYGIPIFIALIVCFIKSKLPFLQIQDDNINEVMKSTLTVSSILFGFFGTMLGQLINAKSKYDKDDSNVITAFFKTVDNTEIRLTMMINVFNTVLIDLFSMLVLLCNKNSNILKIWFFILIIFTLNLTYVYYVFIKLLIFKKGEPKIHDKMSEEALNNMKNKISKKNHP